jgi:hypothetical protein
MEDSMITTNPKIAMTKQHQQGRSTQQATGQMRAFSQSQSSSASATGLLPEAPSLQNIMVLIQQLILQLQQQESGGQEPAPRQEQGK